MAVMIKKNPVFNERRDDRKYPHGGQFFTFWILASPLLDSILSGLTHALIQVGDHDKRGSNVIAENIVIMTTKANINAPIAG